MAIICVQSSQDVMVQIQSAVLCGPKQKLDWKSSDPALEVKMFIYLPCDYHYKICRKWNKDVLSERNLGRS